MFSVVQVSKSRSFSLVLNQNGSSNRLEDVVLGLIEVPGEISRNNFSREMFGHYLNSESMINNVVLSTFSA